MSVLTPSLPSTSGVVGAPTTSAPTGCRAEVVIEDRIQIPGWVSTLREYRDWAESDQYPQSGWVSYLDGTIWVDPGMEEFLTHNRMRQAFGFMYGALLTTHPVGCFVPDRMLLVNVAANLSTEPDGLFYLWETMRSGKLRLVPGKKTGYMQLEGTPDTVLEILSDSSEKKDLVILRDLYWKAQIPEYWIVDVRGPEIRFEILRHQQEAYEPAPVEEGWTRSGVLQHAFRIEKVNDPLGYPNFIVHVKP